MIYRLDEDIAFPDPRLGEPSGLFAVGGDLSVDRLLLAYCNGIFPWYPFKDDEEIQWHCPMQRFVIFPDEIHVSHSMRTLLNKNKYQLTIGHDFDGVIQGCSQQRIDMEGAWLGPDMIEAFTRLNRIGIAQSVEVWDNSSGSRQLVGGLYGVNIGRNFIGESMFSLVPSASKLALIFLARTMQRLGGTFIDCQLETPHLKSMGGRYISYDEYMRIFNEGCKISE